MSTRRVRRQLPRPRDLAPLVRMRPPRLDATRRRLESAFTIADLRAIARRRVPRAVFDYVDGAAEQEISLQRARDAYARVEFSPRILRDVGSVDTATTVLGGSASLPMVLAPTGFTRMMHHEGERAVGRAAEAASLPYALSTMGTTSPEELAAEAPLGRHWFQLYLWRDRDASSDLVDRARKAGYDTLVLTVDTPVAGVRLRDSHNGLTIPPSLTVRTLSDMARHPAWWVNVLTTEPLTFAALNSWSGTVAELVGHMFDPTAVAADLTWLREQWPGHLVVKGIQHVDDARAVVDLGADGIVVSNHGGRQLDRAPTPLELLPDAAAAVGERAEVFVDTGITTGADLIAARALGARAALVGRAYLYGLMAGGEDGVTRALDILRAEAVRTLQLIGVERVDDLDASHARLLPR
ncbi:alpha-hydroxy-acid oxidizing protein [Actinomycetospora endophytica]|uniref:Alpha-hydroxy-acid oxidizing protein n=1 Tax=Actinomycetospora endophytica TaxID=2291215 RepID=A0ABS8PDL0_9PSEU|nr:alpha-hydroxy acid oxidase [Actinomycetospora endophytica]MCD2196249.1 alpha-hydroxy-acid oxidizing protein [Actinomycetospora endophytica]